MSNKKSCKDNKFKNLGRRKFPFVLIVLILGATLAIGTCNYIFKRIVLSPHGRFRAQHSEINYPEGYSVRGIDISRYQGVINWDEVKTDRIGGENIQFVFIKATEGVSVFDPHFNDNFYQAREKGILRGAYHYFSPSETGERQAQHFIRQVHLEEGDLPPVLDVEELGGLSSTTLRKEVIKWLEIVETHYGVKPIIYSGNNFKKKHLSTPEFRAYPFWIAHYYKDKLDYDGDWVFWQHTDLGDVKGIEGEVDLNIFNGSLNDLHALTIDCMKN